MPLSQVKRQNPSPWAARPSGVAQASLLAVTSCRLPPRPPALKCCSACATTKPPKVVVAVAMPAVVTVVAVAVKLRVATEGAMVEAVARTAVASFSPPGHKVHAPHKAVARAVKAVATPSSSRPQALPMKVAHRAPLLRNLTPCAPASI